jgi:hypothetical protein
MFVLRYSIKLYFFKLFFDFAIEQNKVISNGTLTKEWAHKKMKNYPKTLI